MRLIILRELQLTMVVVDDDCPEVNLVTQPTASVPFSGECMEDILTDSRLPFPDMR